MRADLLHSLPKSRPEKSSVFFADYYSKATSPADRQLARARLSPGLRALANNTVEEFDRFCSGYAKAVVDEVTPVGPNTFAIGAT